MVVLGRFLSIRWAKGHGNRKIFSRQHIGRMAHPPAPALDEIITAEGTAPDLVRAKGLGSTGGGREQHASLNHASGKPAAMSR